MREQNTSLAAAGIAFFMVWAFFPALAIIVVIGARLVGKPAVLSWLSSLRPSLPDSFNVVVVSQLDAIAEHSPGLSLLTVLIALGFSLWSGMRGARSLMAALNLVYAAEESRSFWHRQAVAFAFCVLSGTFVVAALALIVGLAGVEFTSSTPIESALLAPTRWPVLIVAMMLLLSVAYRYGPCRRLAKWRWVTWGASASAIIWVIASAMLSYYAAHFNHFNPLLGSLGSVMLFLFWCYLTVLAVLLGAQINAELERHTVKDTTVREILTAQPVKRAGKRRAARIHTAK